MDEGLKITGGSLFLGEQATQTGITAGEFVKITGEYKKSADRRDGKIASRSPMWINPVWHSFSN